MMTDYVERPGLYIMVFFALLNSCDAEENTEKILHILSDESSSMTTEETRGKEPTQ